MENSCSIGCVLKYYMTNKYKLLKQGYAMEFVMTILEGAWRYVNPDPRRYGYRRHSAFIIYKVMLLIRSTSTARVARSILFLLALTWIRCGHINGFTGFSTKIIEVGVIALVIVFQPELRRVLERFGAKEYPALVHSDSSANRSEVH